MGDSAQQLVLGIADRLLDQASRSERGVRRKSWASQEELGFEDVGVEPQTLGGLWMGSGVNHNVLYTQDRT